MDAAATSGDAKLFRSNMGGAHIVGGEQGEKRRSLGGSFDRGSAIHLLPIDQAKHAEHLKLRVARGLDGLDGGGAGGANVVDDNHACAGLVEAFNAATGAMRLFRFSDEKAVDEWRIGMLKMIPRAGGGDVRNQRVRAHGEAADGLRLQVMF